MVVAAIVGMAIWLASYLALSFALGLLSGPITGLAMLFRVQPYKAITWIAIQVLSLWAGWGGFQNISG